MIKDDAPVLGGAGLIESFESVQKRAGGDESLISKIDIKAFLDLDLALKEEKTFQKFPYKNEYLQEERQYTKEEFKSRALKDFNFTAFNKILDDPDLQDLGLSAEELKKRLEDSRVKARLHVRAGCPIGYTVDVVGVVVGKRQTLKI